MIWSVWLKGVLMGLAIAAPVGPIALLCVRRSLTQGRWVGLATGLGAASADGLYGVVAAFGLSAVSELLAQNTRYLQILGGLFLVYLGLTTFLAKSDLSKSSAIATVRGLEDSDDDVTLNGSASPKLTRSTSLVGAYVSTLALTLTNPATILSFLAIFASLGITQASYLRSVTLVFGVFTGSVVWWLVLVSGVVYLRNRLSAVRLMRFNQWSTKVFGVLILGFGVVALVA